MARRFEVGDTARVSRAQNGAGHEDATVIDVYDLLMEGDKIPMVVVDFDDGQRMWVRDEEPDVLLPEPEEEDARDDEPAGETETEPADG
jgi:hypothetical protein